MLARNARERRRRRWVVGFRARRRPRCALELGVDWEPRLGRRSLRRWRVGPDRLVIGRLLAEAAGGGCPSVSR